MQNKAKPFLKWAGGKTQLIKDISKTLPSNLVFEEFTYIEPFVGSGAVLFWMLNNYPKIKKAIINDINHDLINVYKVIASNPIELINILEVYENEFHSLELKPESKKEYYYNKRVTFNERKEDKSTQAALFIFLNRTCFNGLYRVNKSNKFNVPMGSYKKPMICDKNNFKSVSKILEKVEILSGDYENTLKYAGNNTIFYLDPPYKPINKTSSFISYSFDTFDDKEQIRLSNFCKKLDTLNHIWLLSNSDVNDINKSNNFFDDLYKDFQIERVDARRSINSNPEKRGKLKELLISNQSNRQEYVRSI